jgi:endoglucanase
MLRFLPFLLLSLSCVNASAQSVAHQRCAAMGKGMNISNWLEAPWQAGWPTPDGYTRASLQLMQEAGIQSLRLPVQFFQVVDTLPPYTVDLDHPLFERIDSVIVWADDLGMNLIIDNHHGWDLNDNIWRNRQGAFTHLWSVLAQRYAGLDPGRYTFELLNEPTLFFSGDSLEVLFNDAIDSIRQHTAEHTIIVSPHLGGSALALPEMPLYPDTNLIYTWHTYDPLDFTHQGLTWNTPFFPEGNPFPHPDTSFLEHWVYNGWQNVADWKTQNGLPIMLGEFGVSNYADDTSACNWMTYVGLHLRDLDIPWFYWDWQWDFTMFYSNFIGADSIIPCFRTALGLYGDETLGVMDDQRMADALIWPNPAEAGAPLQFMAGALDVQILATDGRLMAQGAHAALSAPAVPGLYVAQWSIDGRYFRTKLVVR